MNTKIQKVFSFKYHSWVNVFIHIASMLMFFLPEVITNIDDNRPMPYGVIIKTLIYIALFYINYFTINYFLDKKGGRWKFFGMNFILLVVASFIMYFTSHGYTDPNFHPVKKPPINYEEAISFRETTPPHAYAPVPNGITPEHMPPHHKNTFTHAMARLSRDIMFAILVIALAFAVRVTLRWLNEQSIRASLLASQREIELENLKSQINPHFLFNTLNSIYALIDINPSQAQKAIHDLSGLMRYALYEANEMVALSQEIAFLKSYITLMMMRIGEQHEIRTSLTCNNHCDYNIAPLLFIPIIENAFKYGNTDNKEHPIIIDISVSNEMVRCYTFNHFKEKDNNKKESGIGLTNLQRRLNLIYGENASFIIIEQGNTYQVELKINLNNPKN